MGSMGESNSTAELYKLFEAIEKDLSKTSLGDDRWYLLVISCLTGGSEPELAQQLYLYLTSQQRYQSPVSRQALVRRLREALVKLVSIVGVCKPLEAIMAINQVEQDEDKDHTYTRKGWQCDEHNTERAMGWMRKLYSKNTNATIDLFKDHQDFAWLSVNITYGLYLSDRQVLDDMDTQMVVLPGIMIQNLRTETHWHIRGTRRLGLSRGDTEKVWNCVQSMADMMGIALSRVPSVADVEPDI